MPAPRSISKSLASALRRPVNRRRLIKSATFTFGGLLGLNKVGFAQNSISNAYASTTSPSVYDSPFLAGHIVDFELPDRVVLDPDVPSEASDESAITVIVRSGTSVEDISRDSVSAFEVREEVVAEGTWDGNVFHANSFANLFRIDRTLA